MRCGRYCIALLLFLCLGCSLSFGWGCSGHQIVALIAEQQLSANARHAVLDLLGDTPIDPALKRFCGATTLGLMADVSTWADDYRSQDSTTASWHFVDPPLNASESALNDTCGQGCVTEAIRQQLKVLQSTAAERKARVNALMFVIHFIGDLHQPLHVVSNNDRGANCLPVAFFELKPQADDKGNYSPNLHAVWDTSILERIAGIRRETHDADVKHFAEEVARRYRPQIVRAKQTSTDPDAWAWESHQLAVKVAYGKLPDAITPENPTPVATCADDNNIGQRMLALNERIGQPYVAAATPVIERQLALAGARLAGVLNRVLGAKASE